MMAKSLSFVSFVVTDISALAFDHLRNSEELFIRIGRVRKCFVVGQRLPQSFQNIFARGIRKSLAPLLTLIDTISIGDLRHRRHIRRIQFIQTIHIIQNRIQVAKHSAPLLFCQLEIGEIGDVRYVFFGDFHSI